MKFLSWQGKHLALNQNLSGSRTETRTSKLATVFGGALLAGCLGGLFEIMHGDGRRGMISKVVIIMPLSGRDLETARGAGGGGRRGSVPRDALRSSALSTLQPEKNLRDQTPAGMLQILCGLFPPPPPADLLASPRFTSALLIICSR